MLAIISPAKSLDFETELPAHSSTLPRLLAHSEELIAECRRLAPKDLERLMSISPKLAQLNAERFLQWQQPFTTQNARAAVYSFIGDVYLGLDIRSLESAVAQSAQQQLRILSGLYGLLRPFDLMQAYRLEMGTELPTPRGKNLYAFWGNLITELLNADLAELGHHTLVNLASNEYFKAVKSNAIKAEIVTPVFKDYKDGQLKMISFFAKKARGMMVRYMLQNKPQHKEELKGFDYDGYQYDPKLSTDNQYVFVR